MSVISFPKIGSRKTVPLFEAPRRLKNKEGREEPEDLFAERLKAYELVKHVTVSTKLAAREKVRGWAYAFAKALADDGKRARAAGVEDIGTTPEGHAEMMELHRKVLRECEVSVSGIAYGDDDLSLCGDIERLISALDDLELLAAVSAVVRDAQSPTPQQKN